VGAAGQETLGESSPVAAFVRAAPRLDPHGALLPQLDKLLTEHRPLNGPARLTSSVPGQSATLLRGLFYRLIGIPEPTAPAALDPLPLPPYEPPLRTAPLRVLTRVTADGTIAVQRYAEPRYEPDDAEGEGHVAVHEETLDPGVLELADVIFRYGAAHDPRLGPPQEWAAEVLDRYRSASLAAYITGPRECTVLHRSGLRFELSAESDGDPAAHASALHARLHTGTDAAELMATGLAVTTGTRVELVRVTVVQAGTEPSTLPGS
jgi:hypothetical protein